MAAGFQSPFEVPAPAGVEGWESMYPYYALFSEERRDSEEVRGWFRDGMHFPEPMYPFDFVTADSPYLCLGQANSRIFLVPPALGIDHRVLYGWVYMSANGVADPEEIGRRAQEFEKRAGYYFQNWDELYGRWQGKVEEEIRGIESLEVPDLPEWEDEAVVMEGRGLGSSHTLLVAYNRLLESIDRIWQYHFEFLNLGYAAYLVFYQQCKEAFPDIADQTIAKMVSGVDVVLFRPDEELKRLARAAIDAGVADEVASAADEDALRTAVAGKGDAWLADWDAVKQPWFNYSNGNGFYHHHRSWIDDPAIPLAAVGSYIEKLQAGEEIARPLEAVSAERDRVTADYRELIDDDAAREAFDQTLGLSRTVFPYVESHNFYVEHWYHTLFWNKVREFGELLVLGGFFAEADDIFYLQRSEVSDALVDLRLAWAAGSAPRGPGYWPPIVAKRKQIVEAMRGWSPPPALGGVPAEITEPMTIMLWGITSERVQEWAGAGNGDGDGAALTGFAGSGGVVEGTARVILDVRDIGKLEEGEILVAPVTSPSWTPVFGKVAAAVSDIGGIMSHAAIVAREYGMPAVVGTGSATARIKTGDRVRVDGDNGVVTIL